jgi:hypothetical protein
MKRCNLDCQFLSEFDLFGKDPEFYFKGKPQRTSKFGKFLTYFYITIYVGFFLYKIIRMLKKVDITFFESYAYSGIPSIKLTNNLFYGGFSLDGVIDPSLYYPLVYYYKGHRENGIMIWEEPYEIVELEICQIEKFGKKYRDIFKNKDLDHSYCLKDVEKITLEGYSHLDSFKYLYVAFMPCVGINPITQTACQSETDVKNYFMKGAKITFNIEDIELTPHLYDTPSQPLEKDINGPCFLTLYQQIYTYLQIVILETDQDWIGFEGLSDIETEQFLKYDESWIVAAPSPHSLDLDARTPLAEVTVQLSSKVLTQKRKNTKLIEVLGDVGGLMEVVWSFFNILSSVITDLLYQKALINNLFTFDLDKKIVKLKKKNSLNEKETMKLNDCPKIYSLNSRNDALSGKIINKQDPSKDKLDEDALNKKFDIEVPKTVKKKKKKKLKNKLTIGSSISKNNELTNKNLEEDHLKNPDEIDIYNNDNPNNVNHFNNGHGMPSEDKFINKETERNIYSRRIVDRIKVNCCCIYFWFCFARKKKNTQNVLWDEGMDILVENLDIMNIFKKVYNMNLVEETLKVNELFDMSEKCKTKIDALDQMFLKKQIKE